MHAKVNHSGAADPESEKRRSVKALRRRARMIGLFVNPEISSDDQLLQGVLNHARGRELNWNFYSAYQGDILIDQSRRRIRLDGMLVRRSGEPWKKAIRLAQDLRIPMVALGAPSPGPACPAVVPDDLAIGRAVAEHFLVRGFVRFAFCGFVNLEYYNVRLAGFREGLAGQPATSYEDPSEWSIEIESTSRRRRLDAWLASLEKPVAIMTARDSRSRQLLASCRRLGLRVPQDVAICVADDETICAMDTPMLSSVPLNRFRAGQVAAELLDRLMRGEPPPAPIVAIPPQPLIVRQSSDLFAVADPDVRAALQFIDAQADRPMSVARVVDVVLISRSGLERKFRRQLGRGIQEEIWAAHVERAKRLLAQKSDDIRAVAKASGFHSPERLSVVFRRLTGSTPSDYRQAHGSGENSF